MLPALLLILLPLAGCTTLTSGTKFINGSCTEFKVIRYSKDDTSDTIAQVRASNRVWHALCDVKP